MHVHLYSLTPPVSTKSHSCPNVHVCLHTCAPVIHLTKLLLPTSNPLERSPAQTDLGLIFLLHKHWASHLNEKFPDDHLCTEINDCMVLY